MKKYTVEYYKDKKKEFRLRIKHRNKKNILCSGEGVKSKSGLLKTLANCVKALSNEDFEFKDLTKKLK